MVMTTLSDAVVNDIQGLLDQHISKLWDSCDCVLVDNNCQLLVRIYLNDSEKHLHNTNSPIIEIEAPPRQRIELINKTLFDILDPRLPRRKGDYSWMACIYVVKQVDAMMGGMQTSES
jgi:hypothetical protein